MLQVDEPNQSISDELQFLSMNQRPLQIQHITEI